MKRLLTLAFIFCLMAVSASGRTARGIDPKADSIAVVRMRERMDDIRQYRPTVALVLSGGGAKGAAHVGVIRYLEELGIPVDMVLGTSMGALLGGMYSLGYSVDQIDSLMSGMDWEWALSDRLSRKYITYSDLKYKEKYLLSIPFFYERDYYRMMRADENRFDPAHRKDILHVGADNEDGAEFLKKNLLGSLPSGYIYGQNVSNLISSLTIGYQDPMSFQDFPIPFVCVAADMVSGKAKIWHEGKINDALRSTMSIPGMFAPVRVDGMVLVDGGLRDNYPTALAREMGADIIIGVDLSESRRTYTDINNIGDIISQGVDMLMRESLDRNIEIPDVKIKPQLRGFGMMSFDTASIDTIKVRGYEAAVAQDSLLREVASKTRVGYSKSIKPSAYGFETDSLVLADVEIKGVLPREEELLEKRLDLKFGQKISKEDLNDIVAKIYGTQSYDYVTYELLGDSEPFKLVLNCRKGPVHQLGMGVRADTEEIVSVLLNLGFNAHKLHGHIYDFSAKISANPYVQFHWSYDLPKMPTINAKAALRWTNLDMLNFGNNDLSLSYLCAKQEVFLSNIKWKQFDIKSGIRNEVFNIRNIKSSEIIGDYDLEHLTNDFVSLYLDARTDTFDDGYFPTKGVNAGVSYAWVFTGFPYRADNFHILQADARTVVPIGDRFAFIPSLNCRFLIGHDIPVAYFNAVGGSLPGRYVDQQIPFLGVTNLHAMKNMLTIYRADLRFKLARNHYLTGIVNYARECDALKDYAYGPGYTGVALEYSFDTIFGPLSANVHWSDMTGKVGFYISAGYSF
ncbi:MAG: patatin-like phospholipase family protein [Bacteroidales bacterium]|nr:patatin-like phospholipase family protein [Bacteroidales bacterium]